MDFFDPERGGASFLDRLGAGFANQADPSYLARLQERKRQEAQRSELARLAQNPELAQNPTALVQKIAQTTGDPSALLKWAEMNNTRPEYQIIQSGNGGYVVVDKNNPFKPAATYGAPTANNPQSGLGKLKADRDAGLIDEETYRAAVKKDTERAPRQFNQFQTTAAGFADRMAKAQNRIVDLETGGEGGAPKIDLVSEVSNFLEGVPSFGLGKALGNAQLTPEQQTYKTAAHDWIAANLRKESGAVLSPSEIEAEYKRYFPVTGDSPQVIAQKRAMRDTTANTLIQQSAGAYDEQYGTPTGGQGNGKKEAKPAITKEEALAELRRRGKL